MSPFPIRRATFLLLLGGMAALSACRRKPLTDRLVADDYEVRAKAFQKLEKLPMEKKSALIEPLISRLQGGDAVAADRASHALAVIGVPAVTSLVPLLRHPDVYVRLTAVTTLHLLKEDARETIPHLIQLVLGDPHPLVREEAVLSVADFQSVPESGVKALVECYQTDTDPLVRQAAENALNRMGVKLPKPSRRKATPKA